MNDIQFWAEYGLLIIFGGLATLMILITIILVEIDLRKKRRKEKSK